MTYLAKCSDCGRESIEPHPSDRAEEWDTGWHVTPDGHLVCWQCTIRNDQEWERGR